MQDNQFGQEKKSIIEHLKSGFNSFQGFAFIVGILGSAVTLGLLVLAFVQRNSYMIFNTEYALMFLGAILAVNILVTKKLPIIPFVALNVTILGLFVYNTVFGVESIIANATTNFLVILPSLVFSTLLYVSYKAPKKLKKLFTVVSAALLAVTSIVPYVFMSLRSTPTLQSLLKGQNDYLNKISNTSVKNRPNILFILADDLGYGDISGLGNSSNRIQTPTLDALMHSGITMDNFYAAAPLCTPSRYSILTGRYPSRGGLERVLWPTEISLDPYNYSWFWNTLNFKNNVDGILADEITMAEVLQSVGYDTALFGKWHLGEYGQYLPNVQGFDYFYGTPNVNGMPLYPWYRNDELIDPNLIDLATITPTLTEEITTFLDNTDEDPFFVMYSTPWPHSPFMVSDEFAGQSDAGIYGDVIEELDDSIGKIIIKLKETGEYDNTIIIFMSDNGAAVEGSNGALRGRKQTAREGGMRVPFIISYPDGFQQDVTYSAPAMAIDLLPTVMGLLDIELPTDRIIDGIDLSSLFEEGINPNANINRDLYFFADNRLLAMRTDNFKYYPIFESETINYLGGAEKNYLIDIVHDIDEAYNVRTLYPSIAEEMAKRFETFRLDARTNVRGIID